MKSGITTAAPATLSWLDGRRLTFSPVWDEDELSVVFDAASGDFWVVACEARRLIEHLGVSPLMDADAIEMLRSGDLPAPDSARAILDNLVEVGILQRNAT